MVMIIAARSPAAKPESSRAATSGTAASRNCRYVIRERSRSRSASMRHTSLGQRSIASRKAALSEPYSAKFNIERLRKSYRALIDCDYKWEQRRSLTFSPHGIPLLCAQVSKFGEASLLPLEEKSVFFFLQVPYSRKNAGSCSREISLFFVMIFCVEVLSLPLVVYKAIPDLANMLNYG